MEDNIFLLLLTFIKLIVLNRFVFDNQCPIGILYRGDGSNIYLKEKRRKVVTVLGNGYQRRLDCRGCDGRAVDNQLMAPVALASGRDGSVYVGDYNHIRRLSPGRDDVTSILNLRFEMLQLPVELGLASGQVV